MANGVMLKSLKKGDFFTLRPIESPLDSQVFIRREYDRSERLYVCEKFSDISCYRYLSGDRVVYTDFTF